MGLLHESTSREKRVGVISTLAALLFLLIYLVAFPRTLPTEFTLIPVEAQNLAETKADHLDPGGSFFDLGNWEGYWGPDGRIERVQQKRPQSSAWADQMVWYDPTKNQVVVEGPKGILFTLAGEQYPYWARGRLFTLDENRLVLKAYTAQGAVLWTKHFASLITSLDASSRLTVVGTLDGRVQVFESKGEAVGGFQPGGSRLPVIYNVAVSPRDNSILVLAGIDPKRFLVLERGGSEFRPVFHKALRENRPWPTPLGFLNAGTLAYYQTETGLAFLDPKDPEKEVVVPTRGDPVAMESLPGGHQMAFVQRDGAKTDLRVATQSGTNVLTIPFSSQDILLQRQGNWLLVGVDQTLLRFEVKYQ